MKFSVTRAGSPFRIRQWTVELYSEFGEKLDSRRMFGGCFFEWRLYRKMKRMLLMASKVRHVLLTTTF